MDASDLPTMQQGEPGPQIHMSQQVAVKEGLAHSHSELFVCARVLIVSVRVKAAFATCKHVSNM